jgi:Na+-driven multidrug efflux pump
MSGEVSNVMNFPTRFFIKFLSWKILPQRHKRNILCMVDIQNETRVLRYFLTLVREEGEVMEREENILGTEKISRLLLKFGVPGAVSLVVNSLYNIVDQIFIGQGVGFLGNAATNLIYPLSVFVLAVGALMGDGSAAYMSLKLGQNEKDEAAKSAAFGLIGSVAAGILIAVLYLIFMKPLCWALGE